MLEVSDPLSEERKLNLAVFLFALCEQIDPLSKLLFASMIFSIESRELASLILLFLFRPPTSSLVDFCSWYSNTSSSKERLKLSERVDFFSKSEVFLFLGWSLTFLGVFLLIAPAPLTVIRYVTLGFKGYSRAGSCSIFQISSFSPEIGEILNPEEPKLE